MLSMLYGIDEAGRGPILGPMVLACVGLTYDQAQRLVRAGVKDSKAFGSGFKAELHREKLATVIRAEVTYAAVSFAQPWVIDAEVARKALNQLERTMALELLRGLHVDYDATIVCDGANLFKDLRHHYPKLEARDKADVDCTAVAAASVLAKHERDKAWRKIEAAYLVEYGPISGGGYLTKATRAFVERYRAKHGELPPEARKSWKLTAQA